MHLIEQSIVVVTPRSRIRDKYLSIVYILNFMCMFMSFYLLSGMLLAQPVFSCSKLTMETSEQCAKYVQD